jgi:glycosyltransferase involved in cell wall biosynthesis
MRYIKKLRDALDERRVDWNVPSRTGLSWKRGLPCRHGLYDVGAAQVGKHLYILGGYFELGAVSDWIEIFDLENRVWLPPRPLAAGVAHSHATVATDGVRYLYIVSGQVGSECKPAVRDVFAYDTITGRWTTLPQVPAARYAAVTQLWNGRLHFIGGAKEDRWTPASEHWSLGVSGETAVEESWREEIPIPVGGMHRGSIVANNSLYVLGGQQGDFMAIPGDPDCRCTGATQESYLGSCFRLDTLSAPWTRLADMPIAVSHIDCSTVLHKNTILLVGGQAYKDPTTFALRLTDAIQSYDMRSGTWDILGHLPYRLKIPAVGVLGDELTATLGQRGKRRSDRPGPISAATWHTTLPSKAKSYERRGDFFSGKSVLLMSHELTRSGAPLVLLELARELLDRGATVRVATVADDARGWSLAAEKCVPLIPLESALTIARNSDLVVANTISAPMKAWVEACLDEAPEVADRLLWWVHEIDVEVFKPSASLLYRASTVVFDSEAARSAWEAEVALPERTHVMYPPLDEALVGKSAETRFVLPRNKARSDQPSQFGCREEIRRILGVGPKDFLVCNVGSVGLRKGQRELVRALATHSSDHELPLRLVLVGFRDWAQRAKFLLSLSNQERRVLSPSRAFVRQRDLSPFYAASDAFVMNTQGIAGNRGESFGRVTAEAMLFGLPVLGTSAGGTVEIIKDGETGMLFPIGDTGQTLLVEQIKKLAADRESARNMGAAARLDVLGRFRWESFMTAFEYAAAGTALSPRN